MSLLLHLEKFERIFICIDNESNVIDDETSVSYLAVFISSYGMKSLKVFVIYGYRKKTLSGVFESQANKGNDSLSAIRERWKSVKILVLPSG